MPDTPPSSTASRLLAAPSGEPADAREQVRLLRQLLHHSALWARALSCPAAWPFFDVAARLLPELRALEDTVRAVEEHLRALQLSTRVIRLSVWALHWDEVRHRPEAAGLPDPYEPLVRLVERGGSFYTEHGFIDVEGAALPIGQLADHLSPRPDPAP